MTTIVVIGPPGAGKGTRIQKAIAEEVIPNLKHISTGNLLRKKGIDTSSGKLVSDDLIMEILKEELESIEKDSVVILDGVPRTMEQANLMQQYGIQVDKVVYLPVTEEEAVRRAEQRIICPNCQQAYTLDGFKPPKVKGICDTCGVNLVKRPDDNAETAKKRLEIYKTATEPLIDFFKNNNITVSEVATTEPFDVFINLLAN